MLGGGLLSVFSSVLVLLEFDGIEFPEPLATALCYGLIKFTLTYTMQLEVLLSPHVPDIKRSLST